jgi:hypothetical protein
MVPGCLVPSIPQAGGKSRRTEESGNSPRVSILVGEVEANYGDQSAQGNECRESLLQHFYDN